MLLEPGLSARAELHVADVDTAVSMGSGDVPVLGTPRIIALCEQASLAAVAGRLGAAETSVGMRVQIDHLAPTAVGQDVSADATLEKVEGRRLVFTVSVNDARGLVACGRVTRVVVDRDRFLDRSLSG